MRLFDIRYLVADAGYGKDRNSALLKAFPGRVWSCWYPVMEKTSKVFEPQWQDQEHKVTVDRTTSLKLAARSFREHEVVLCDLRRLEIWRTFLSHLTNLAASKEQDDETGEIIETIKPTGPDHLVHAYNYLWTAFTGKLLRPGGRTFIFFLG
ncbi:MAG: hypothetical protein HY660_18160 [Armatimonadetes bacterium]|nr:hypothetical protein [Armatimonadota bacterium]